MELVVVGTIGRKATQKLLTAIKAMAPDAAVIGSSRDHSINVSVGPKRGRKERPRRPGIAGGGGHGADGPVGTA
jgi:hypothetical protein